MRAKAGGRQSARDATGRAPQSAGASLRRYNEQALQKVSFHPTSSIELSTGVSTLCPVDFQRSFRFKDNIF